MSQHKIVYTADLHGNEMQYKKLVDYAMEVSADSVIIGGDIAPKGKPFSSYISMQREFLEYQLPKLIMPLKKNLPSSGVFLIMGNDDCSVNVDVLKKNDNKLFHLIHGNRLKLNDNFEIVGYSYVPITPFVIKDWEKYDFSAVPKEYKDGYEMIKRGTYALNGLKSSKKGWRKSLFSPKIEQRSSVQKDLEDSLFTESAKKTVYAIHTPPYDTCLDLVYLSPPERMPDGAVIETISFDKDGRIVNPNSFHVGSMALRSFIEQHQPYLTLHGHIHETVEISGEFKDNIGDTLCLSAGNDNKSDKLAVIVFDLYNLDKVKRVLL